MPPPPVRRPVIHLQPINWVQRIALYVTHSRYYLVGSNNTQTTFKVLKIDRTEKELSIVDDRIEYTYHEIRDLLVRVDQGNRVGKNQPGVEKSVSSFGLIGFVRFLHGYYLILIIKRRKVAALGHHTIYKVEDTRLVYIPNEDPKEYAYEEARYVKAFNSVDMASNFYYSYSYDLTHTLQYNLSPVGGAKFFQKYHARRDKHTSSPGSEENNLVTDSIHTTLGETTKPTTTILVKTKPHVRFVWNSHLIDFEELHDDWRVHLIHGFVAQGNISVLSRPIYISLIARRSRKYCGTRFLKRGLNLEGDVANEVETEQIVHDASLSDLKLGRFTSFVQLRGSLPDRWSQDATKIVPKPSINRDFYDPYHVATANHFNDLLKRYGTPVVVLNLVKQKESKPHECVLSEMIKDSVSYLNQFLPPQHIIRLMAFDMARCTKSQTENVMQRLGKIGFNIVRCTGIFQSWKSKKRTNYDHSHSLKMRQQTFNRKPSSAQIVGYRLSTGQCLQNGIVRVNCVDSLDRTNTAQFALGKVALGFQLQALGVLIEPSLNFDTDAVRLLEQLYEDHGDTIALQYGGSQLVHRVKSYRKTAPLTSQSSEIMQSLSRYYSNTFSDAEKQNVINIFLGVRKAAPINAKAILTDPPTDFYLHNPQLLKPFYLSEVKSNHNLWWDRRLERSLPRAYVEYEKESCAYSIELRPDSLTLRERVDYFFDNYRPHELTYLASSFPNLILHTIKDFMPNGSSNYSPFCLRLGPGKLKEKYLNKSKRLPPNPSVYGLPSTSSSASEDLSLLDGSDSSDDNSEQSGPSSVTPSKITSSRSFTRRLSKSRYAAIRYLNDDQAEAETNRLIQFYDTITCPISPEDNELYRSYVDIDSVSTNAKMNVSHDVSMWNDMSLFEIPHVPKLSKPNKSAITYECCPPSDADMSLYHAYILANNSSFVR